MIVYDELPSQYSNNGEKTYTKLIKIFLYGAPLFTASMGAQNGTTLDQK